MKYAHCTIETALICHSHVQIVHRDTAATLGGFSDPFFSSKQKKMFYIISLLQDVTLQQLLSTDLI